MEHVDADLDSLATRLRKTFGHMKTVQNKANYRPHPRFNRAELWLKVAERCRSLCADPDDFLDAAFQHCTVPGGPFPQMLASEAAARWYNKHRDLLCADMGLKPGETLRFRKLQMALREKTIMCVRMAMARKLSLSEVLLDEFNCRVSELPAYLRILILPCAAVVQKWQVKARREVEGNPRIADALRQLFQQAPWNGRPPWAES